jgi:hypothetical protein
VKIFSSGGSAKGLSPSFISKMEPLPFYPEIWDFEEFIEEDMMNLIYLNHCLRVLTNSACMFSFSSLVM